MKQALGLIIGLVFSLTASAQQGFLGGWNQQQRLNEESTLRNLQALQMQLQAIQQAQQIRQQQDERGRQAQDQVQAIQERGRTLIADRAKDSCIGLLMGDQGARNILGAQGKTTGQICGCVEQEMLELLTLDLTSQILVALNTYSDNQSGFLTSEPGKAYASRFGEALVGCARQK